MPPSYQGINEPQKLKKTRMRNWRALRQSKKKNRKKEQFIILKVSTSMYDGLMFEFDYYKLK
jgi:hypothetical protein